MKRLFQKILVKVFKKAVKKAVSNNDVVVPEMERFTWLFDVLRFT